MAFRRLPAVYLLLSLIRFMFVGLDSARADEPAAENEQLSNTVRQFFRALDGFEPGDLIVASEVEDLQDYLRGTWGHNLLTSPRVLRRTTPDKATLSRLFHSPGGKPVLREVAQKLGGFAEIDQLCRHNSGRTILLNAIRQHDATLIFNEVSRRQDVDLADEDSSAASSGHPIRRKPGEKRRLYTVEQMIGEYLADNEDSIATARKPGSKPSNGSSVSTAFQTNES